MMKILSKSIQPNSFFSPEKEIQLFRLVNKNGLEVLITNFGLRLVSLHTPDKNGELDDIILGYDTLEEFETKHEYMNSIIGRVANRIEHGQFDINGEKFQVDNNFKKHCLHGGANGLHMQTWQVKSANSKQIHFYHFSKNGTGGFPGNLELNVYVALTDQNELTLKFNVTTDQPTPINLTYHPYFNLSGSRNEAIANHRLQINANEITGADEDLVATGNFLNVTSTPFDFRNEQQIGAGMLSPFQTIQKCGGYDHNFILNNNSSTNLFLAAKLSEPISKRSLEVWTTQPCIQLYTSNGLDEIGKGNLHYGNHSAVCLEPQHFPNAPNLLHFPTTIITPQAPYLHEYVFKFGVI